MGVPNSYRSRNPLAILEPASEGFLCEREAIRPFNVSKSAGGQAGRWPDANGFLAQATHGLPSPLDGIRSAVPLHSPVAPVRRRIENYLIGYHISRATNPAQSRTFARSLDHPSIRMPGDILRHRKQNRGRTRHAIMPRCSVADGEHGDLATREMVSHHDCTRIQHPSNPL